MSRAHEDLGCTVVLRHHFLSHVFRLIGLFDTRQAKVADLQHAITVHKQIAWLDVSVENSSRVQILQTTKDLIQKHFDVVGR